MTQSTETTLFRRVAALGLAASNGEARRKIWNGLIRVNGAVERDDMRQTVPSDEITLASATP